MHNANLLGLRQAPTGVVSGDLLGFVISRSEYPEWLKGWNQFEPIWTSSKASALVMYGDKLVERMRALAKDHDGIRAELHPFPDVKCQHEKVTWQRINNNSVNTCVECGRAA